MSGLNPTDEVHDEDDREHKHSAHDTKGDNAAFLD